MEKEKSFVNADNAAIENAVNNFRSLWCEKMPETAQIKNTETLDFTDRKDVVLQLDKQFLITDFVQVLKEELGLHLLYTVKYEDGGAYKAVGYSTPSDAGMYVVVVTSSQRGLSDSLTVYFYDSVDCMYRHICVEMDKLKDVPAEIVQQERLSDVMATFY